MGGEYAVFYFSGKVLFIGTQFSNLSTAVDTSASAACNAWCVCVFLFSSFFLRTLHVSGDIRNRVCAFICHMYPSEPTCSRPLPPCLLLPFLIGPFFFFCFANTS